MEPIILCNISFEMDKENLMKRLHIGEGSSHVSNLMELVAEAEKIGKPKALYKVAFIDEKEDDYVIVEGVQLKSRVLRVNLEQAQRIFPYAVTCGTELEEWANQIYDMVQRFWADAIKEDIMRFARTVVEEHLIGHFRPGKLSRMAPGSLVDWPIQEQRPLFQILGNTEEMIGLHLTESLLMVPTKSVSGIWFPTEESFESCQLCPREVCPGRRAPYDSTLFERKYRKK